MLTKLRWVAIGAILLVVIVLVGVVTAKAGWPLGAVLAALFGGLWGATRKKPLPSDARDELVDQVDDGLEATEALAEAEREQAEEKATAEIAAAAADIEERANAPVDPDSAPWRRPRGD